MMKLLALKTLFLSLIVTTSTTFAVEHKPIDYNHFLIHTKVDLNSDGIKEEISIKPIEPVTYTEEENNFLLMIDDVTIKGRLEEGLPDGFTIVDINTRDGYKEVAVHTPGDSTDDEFLIYKYDGNSIKEVGRVSHWPTFYGNGIVLVDEHMDFWSKKDKYVLQKHSHTLKWI